MDTDTREMPEKLYRVTPQGALAAAFSRLAKDANNEGAWWRISPLLAATGLYAYLTESGWDVQPKAEPDA